MSNPAGKPAAKIMTGEKTVACPMCQAPVPISIGWTLAGYKFHQSCYIEAIRRLRPFLQIVFLPEADYKEWLDNDGALYP